MNQAFKAIINKIFFVCILLSIALLQNAELITQKINVENAIRDKVNVTLSKLLDQSQYVIIVNARMDVKAFSMDDNSSTGKGQTRNYYSPIPGLLPTVPQNIKQSTGSTYQYSSDKYLLYGLDIAIYLDESTASGSMKQNITRLVNDAIPELVDCDDCIRFETMSMNNSTSSSYQDLLDKIETLEQDRRDAEEQLVNWRFDQLEGQLLIAQERERSREAADAARLASLQKIELEYRKKQDSLYVLTSINLNEAIKGRIQSESDLNDKLIDIIKSGIDSNADSDVIGGGTDSDIDRSKSGSTGIIMWIALAIILLLLGILILMVLKNKQPVYLKPKGPNKNSTSKSAQNQNFNNTSESTQSAVTDTKASVETLDLSATNANEDGDVMRSELKSLRQSAVAMSVSQKDGANQIVKDWLESSDEGDGNTDEESDNNVEEKK